MRLSITILGLSALLAALPAAAQPEPEELFTPALYAGLTFGGASGVREPRLGLRLDSTRAPAGVATPALMQWELRPGHTELAVAGRTLLATGGQAPGYAEGESKEEGGNRATSIVAVSLLGTAAVVGVVVWAVDDYFDDGFGDEVAAAVIEEGFNSGGEEESDPPPCTGVAVGEECIGGG